MTTISLADIHVAVSSVDMKKRKNNNFRTGDTVRVYQKIEEKGKIRLQVFEGLILARKHGAEAGATFTVRRIASGVGVERIFPLYSPAIEKIEIIKRGKSRRAKLYYIRDKAARDVRKKLRQTRFEKQNIDEVDENKKNEESIDIDKIRDTTEIILDNQEEKNIKNLEISKEAKEETK